MANPANVFERAHHQRIARILESLDPDVLRNHACWFGGGTAVSLRLGEFRESLDIDFLISAAMAFRSLRAHLRGAVDLGPLTRPGLAAFRLTRELRLDQYGIRGWVETDASPIKIEFVHEARVRLNSPNKPDHVCGIASLSWEDLTLCKLIANSDRWRDDITFARDVIDLAHMHLLPRRLAPALQRANDAYGDHVATDLSHAIDALRERDRWLQRCLDALSIREPPAAIIQKLRLLERRLRDATANRRIG